MRIHCAAARTEELDAMRQKHAARARRRFAEESPNNWPERCPLVVGAVSFSLRNGRRSSSVATSKGSSKKRQSNHSLKSSFIEGPASAFDNALVQFNRAAKIIKLTADQVAMIRQPGASWKSNCRSAWTTANSNVHGLPGAAQYRARSSQGRRAVSPGCQRSTKSRLSPSG